MFTRPDKREHADDKYEKSSRRCFSKRNMMIILMLLLLLMVGLIVFIVLLILNPMTHKGTSKANSGHTRVKNATAAFSKGLDSQVMHKDVIDERIEMGSVRTSSASTNEQESICSSLDENMPLLLSILRGEEVQLYDENGTGKNKREQSLIETDANGYQMPFASDIRVVAANQAASSEARGAKLISIKGFNRDLIDRVFRKKHIYFLGDSTCRNLFVALRRLLNYIQFGVPENQNETNRPSSRSLPDKYDGLNYDKWTDSLEMLFAKAEKKWRFGNSLPPYMIPADRTYLRILDVTSLYSETAEQLKAKEQAKLQEEFVKLAQETLVTPDVIIFNAGLHLLHLIPTRKLSHYRYKGWNEYESILETLLQVSTDSQAPLILAKSVNRVCDSKFGPDYRKHARWYKNRNKSTLKTCQKILKEQEKAKKKDAQSNGHNITTLSESQREESCKHGTLSNEGSMLLNQRMSRFLDQKQATVPSNRRLRYFNDHDIESCNFTRGGDGRHYKEQVFVRLHLLAIMIDCMS